VNSILADRLEARLREEGFTVFTGHDVPAGDNGIAVGQVWTVMQRMLGQENNHVPRHSR